MEERAENTRKAEKNENKTTIIEGREKEMQAKKRRWIVPGFMAVIAALFLCIPVMAGGYTVTSALKVNSIGISSWVKESTGIDKILFDMLPDIQLEERLSTASNASKSNAVKGSDFSGKTDGKVQEKDQ